MRQWEPGCRPDETSEEASLKNTKLLIGGPWTAARSGETEQVRSPFDGSVVGEVPTACAEDVELALQAAERGAAVWRRTLGHERMRILLRAAALADEHTAQIHLPNGITARFSELASSTPFLRRRGKCYGEGGIDPVGVGSQRHASRVTAAQQTVLEPRTLLAASLTTLQSRRDT